MENQHAATTKPLASRRLHHPYLSLLIFIFSAPCTVSGLLSHSHTQSDTTTSLRSHLDTTAHPPSRRAALSMPLALLLSTISRPVQAAPPVAVMMEELGYFPVTNQKGDTVYISARVQRGSTDQAVALAAHLRKTGAVMYGAFWCPHCRQQKEIFGREAWASVNYVECAAQGAGADVALCRKKKVDGYPTWVLGNGKTVGGEAPLGEIASKSGFRGEFDQGLEPELPGSGSCR